MVIPLNCQKVALLGHPCAALSCSVLDVYNRDSLKLTSDLTSALSVSDFKNSIIYSVNV